MVDFTFRDVYKITAPTSEDVAIWRDNFSHLGKAGLRVKMEATHAGLINRNRRFYVPSRMAEGVATFRTVEKPTKILKHHDVMSDPVGIIRGARFVPTIPDELQGNPDVELLMSSSAPIKDQLKAFRRLFAAGVLVQDGWRGLGYIELIGDILDPKTIDQVNSGLFDAVSTNFKSPGEAYCSYCSQNVIKEGFCEHDILSGKLYEDEELGAKVPAIPVPGVHKYLETSLIVLEGDEYATITVGDAAEGDKPDYSIPLSEMDTEDKFANKDSFVYEFKDFMEEDNMADKNKPVGLSDAEKEVFELVKKHRPDGEEAVLQDYARKITSLKANEEQIKDQKDAGLDDSTYILYAIEDMETANETIDADAVYAELEKELDELGLAEAKLSSETRKKLSGSTFCGPERSFPVPDCAHVTAARRLIGRYNGPGNKSTILACVSRKAKALGCDSKNRDSNDSTNTGTEFSCPTCDQVASLEDNKVQLLFTMAEAEMISRRLKVPRECSKCAEQELVAKDAEKKAEEIADELKELNVELAALRHELRRSYADYEEQMDQYVNLGAELHQAKVDRLAMISVLVGKHADLEKATDALREADIQAESAALAELFDLQSARDKLNDGMANNPDGEQVDSPVIDPAGENNQLPEGLSTTEYAAIDSIRDLIADKEIRQASKVFAKLKSVGLFDGLDFDSLSAAFQDSAE